ncbi:hypothetical protein ACWXWU_16855 [Shewanella sp. A14]
MTRKGLWAINIVILVCLFACVGAIYSLTSKTPDFMLSCSSELFNHEVGSTDRDHYLLVDLVSKDGLAQINYRYYNLEGNSAGTLAMAGKVNKVDAERQMFDISVTTKQEYSGQKNQVPPVHYSYLSYISGLNLNKNGMHSLSVQVLDRDETKDYAVVLFQPSNTVCGCRLVH